MLLSTNFWVSIVAIVDAVVLALCYGTTSYPLDFVIHLLAWMLLYTLFHHVSEKPRARISHRFPNGYKLLNTLEVSIGVGSIYWIMRIDSNLLDIAVLVCAWFTLNGIVYLVIVTPILKHVLHRHYYNILSERGTRRKRADIENERIDKRSERNYARFLEEQAQNPRPPIE